MAGYKGAEKVVLVMDRLNTHATASLNEAFPPAEGAAESPVGWRRITSEAQQLAEHGGDRDKLLSRDLPERVGDRAAMARHVGAWKSRRNQAGVKAD